MVVISTKNTDNNITSQTTAPTISDPGSFTKTSKAIGAAAELIVETGNQFKKLEELEIKTKASIDFSNQLRVLEEEYISNPDLKGSDVNNFNAQARNMLGKFSENINNSEDKIRFGLQHNTSINSAITAVRSQGHNRDIGRQQVNLDTITEQQRQRVFNTAIDSPQFSLIVADAQKVVMQEIDETIVVGGENIANRAERINAFQDNLRLDKVGHDIEIVRRAKTAQEKVEGLQMLKQRIETNVYDLENQESLNVGNMIDAFIKRYEFENNIEITTAQHDNAIKLHDGIGKNETTINMIADSMAKETLDPLNGINSEDGQNLIRIMTNVDKSIKDNGTVKDSMESSIAGLNLADEFASLNLDDNTFVTKDFKRFPVGRNNDAGILQVSEFRRNVYRAEAAGHITNVEAQGYIDKSSELFKRRLDEKSEDLSEIRGATWTEYKRFLGPKVSQEEIVKSGKKGKVIFGFGKLKEVGVGELRDEARDQRDADVLAIRATLATRFAKELAGIKSEGDARKALKNAKSNFVTAIHPEVLSVPGGVPNSITTSSGSNQVFDGESDAEASVKLPEPDFVVQIDPVTGVRARVFKDGRIQILP